MSYTMNGKLVIDKSTFEQLTGDVSNMAARCLRGGFSRQEAQMNLINIWHRLNAMNTTLSSNNKQEAGRE